MLLISDLMDSNAAFTSVTTDLSQLFSRLHTQIHVEIISFMSWCNQDRRKNKHQWMWWKTAASFWSHFELKQKLCTKCVQRLKWIQQHNGDPFQRIWSAPQRWTKCHFLPLCKKWGGSCHLTLVVSFTARVCTLSSVFTVSLKWHTDVDRNHLWGKYIQGTDGSQAALDSRLRPSPVVPQIQLMVSTEWTSNT